MLLNIQKVFFFFYIVLFRSIRRFLKMVLKPNVCFARWLYMNVTYLEFSKVNVNTSYAWAEDVKVGVPLPRVKQCAQKIVCVCVCSLSLIQMLKTAFLV